MSMSINNDKILLPEVKEDNSNNSNIIKNLTYSLEIANLKLSNMNQNMLSYNTVLKIFEQRQIENNLCMDKLLDDNNKLVDENNKLLNKIKDLEGELSFFKDFII